MFPRTLHKSCTADNNEWLVRNNEVTTDFMATIRRQKLYCMKHKDRRKKQDKIRFGAITLQLGSAYYIHQHFVRHSSQLMSGESGSMMQPTFRSIMAKKNKTKM